MEPAQFRQIAEPHAGLSGQPIPNRTAVLSQTEAPPDGIEEIRAQARARRLCRQRRGEELAAHRNEGGGIDRVPFTRSLPQALHAEHEYEPQQHDPSEASMQAWICEECLGVVVAHRTLMSVVEYDGAAVAHGPGNEVRQQSRVVRFPDELIAEDAGNAECENLTFALAAQPDCRISVACDLPDLQHGRPVHGSGPPP